MQRPRIPRREIDGILLLDKPSGISSNDALQRAKRILRAEKAGHTGSLDPLATGVLPLCFGEATKLCGVLLESDKHYRATARFGERTSTGDAEGAVIAQSDADLLSAEQLQAVIPRFLGAIEQVPPMYSALKHEGRPLYALAREGVEVERRPRTVTIHELALVSFGSGHAVFDVHCSKGTYIRTLIEDVAQAVGQCAHLIGLRRTAVTPFEDEKLIDFSVLEATAQVSEQALDALLMPPAQGLRHWPQVVVGDDGRDRLARGQALSLPGLPAPGSRVAVLDLQRRLLALAQVAPDGRLAPQRWLHARL